MKKLLIATLLLTGLTTLVPTANADCRERVFLGYDRCGRPVYREVYREAYRPSRDYYYEQRPTYYREAPTVRYRSYEEERPRCRETHRHISPLSLIFGF
ncbi:MAG: hypothetical protein K8R23_13890 [Chthoniobacter sp.]|nr:hypothetical protein [Chthoniobacter sp.]